MLDLAGLLISTQNHQYRMQMNGKKQTTFFGKLGLKFLLKIYYLLICTAILIGKENNKKMTNENEYFTFKLNRRIFFHFKTKMFRKYGRNF